MKRTPSRGAAIADSQLWKSSSIFLCALPLPTGGINHKHISEAFAGTIYGEAERARTMSNILGTGFLFCLLKVENLMLVKLKENISEGQTML